ncbi:MAG TPA: CDP-alcohol phosphatidyltransferase family protein [Polyangiaceae bacterium]|nr:CDP-alcohol phosphatidyltransferase family protein [Polyangiaceae bacterium]
MPDFAVSVGLFTVALLSAALYGARVVRRGAARHSRVIEAGSSAFLGEGPMQATYWVLSPVSHALVSVGVSANAITFASLVTSAAAGAAFALGHFGFGALFSVVSTLGDALDGLVARESRTASDAGEVFDAAVDRYGEFLFLAGLAVYYRQNVLLLSLVLFAILGSFMVSYSTAKAEALSVHPPRGAMRRAERAVYLVVGAALVPIVARFHPSWANAPVALSLFLVAVVANASAAMRLDRIVALVNERDAEARRSRGGASRADSAHASH